MKQHLATKFIISSYRMRSAGEHDFFFHSDFVFEIVKCKVKHFD